MGSFKLADAVTGVSLPEGARAVAVVIAKRHGGFPDADKAVAIRPMTPTFLFEPVSLPIHGKADDYGQFIPDLDSLAARLACEMTGQPDWKTFQDKAFEFDGDGLAIRKDQRRARFTGGKSKEEPQIFGLAVFAESTWDMLHAVSKAPERRAGELDAMGRILRDAVGVFSETEDGEDRDRRVYRAIVTVAFRSSGTYRMADGEEIEVPRVGRALDHGEGGDTFADAFKQWLDDLSPFAGNGLGKGSVTPEVDAFVEGLWEMQEAIRGMGYLGKVLTSSPTPGYGHNGAFAVDLGLHTVRQAAEDMLEHVREMGEGRMSDKLRDAVDRIGRLHAELQAGLAKALAFGGEDDPGCDEPEEGPGFAPR